MRTTVLSDPGELSLADDERFEIVDGIHVEKPMGAKSDRVSLRIGGLLDQHCLRSKVGVAFGSTTGYRCFPDQPNMVRKPDASVIRAGRLPDGEVPDGDVLLAPDLVVEVVSPNDSYDHVETKVREYRSANVKLIWIISPIARNAIIRRLDGTIAEVGESGELSGEDVVPGFACKVADLFV